MEGGQDGDTWVTLANAARTLLTQLRQAQLQLSETRTLQNDQMDGAESDVDARTHGGHCSGCRCVRAREDVGILVAEKE